MTITPVGSLSESIAALATTLADCAAFRARVMAGSRADALRSIHYGALIDAEGLRLKRPFASLWFAVAGANAIADGMSVDLRSGGGIWLRFEDNAEHQDCPADSYTDFLNFVGETIDQLHELAGYNDYLPIQDTDMVLQPTRTPRTLRTSQSGENDYWQAVWLVSWGDR